MKNTPLRNQITVQLKSLYFIDYQRFINELYTIIYGVHDFVPMREAKDGACDGIIKSRREVIACYAPKDLTMSRFKKKVDDDYNSYVINLKSEYPKWSFLVNKELTHEHSTYVFNKQQEASILGITQVLSEIEVLSKPQLRKVCEYLGINTDELLSIHYINEIIEALIAGTSSSDQVNYKTPPDIKNKIKINYSEDDLTSIEKEFDLAFNNFFEIENIMKTYEDSQIKALKSRVIGDFNGLSGEFKFRFKQLQKTYLLKISQNEDDDVNWFVASLLYYFFEQCLIGEGVE